MKRILIVDDEPDISYTLSEILELEGYEVLVRANGAEGLQEVRRREPDLVILDMMMPVMDGPAFLRELEQESRLTVPVLVVSASLQPLRSTRATAFLRKPFEMSLLLAKMSKLLGEAAPRK